eukprot:CAMPEP_0170538908 /NCGR_PEP_ID=MMETSP0209-20121228/103603_1 /TAXON_ID=665100 ORGANISM="Litonotus pictus, Strain P1" /NCGR_SAMPLE_ID=MMETSP0209 /ASSEMBLY_ACC=CAM_ASM_000301 /LENGTH=80 /DNA_ID=CAMNT_0010840711 /DNA_START=428 /DNA_END=667 /DNA_ORIENTATION=-
MESIVNLLLTNKSFYSRIISNKVILDALEIKYQKSTGEILYLKEYSWLSKKKTQIHEVTGEVDKFYSSHEEQIEVLANVW